MGYTPLMKITPIVWIAVSLLLADLASAQIVTDGNFTNKGASNGNSIYNGTFNNGGATIGFWNFHSTSGNGTVAPLHAAPLGTTNGSGIILSSQSSAPSENAIVQQAISVVANATLYTLTFDYQSTTSTDNGGLQIFFNGSALVGSPLPGTLTLTHETLTFTATSTGSQNLTFETNHTDNHTSNASVELNNIAVTSTPEPSSVIAVTLLARGRLCCASAEADRTDSSARGSGPVRSLRNPLSMATSRARRPTAD